ncbi:MAG: LCP family protein [Lachnospiraceae bacterium]|nr:LCP family protein [Lachnospiraceae bacterium]
MAEYTRKRKKRRHTGFVVGIIFLLMLIAAIFVYAKLTEGLDHLGRADTRAEEGADPEHQGADNEEPSAQVQVNSGVAAQEHLHGYRNIALIGLDNREGIQSYGNSDTMLIASINNDTKCVRLLSIYRDTFLNMGDGYEGHYHKANNAYNIGSATQLLSMINTNLDLAVTDYVIVDFNAVATLIDDLGGVNISMTADEVTHMNNYCVETSEVTGKGYEKIWPEVEGTYHLNGVQAVGYARIRYTAGNDMKRAARQRLVISKIVEAAKKRGILAFPNIVEDVFPLIKTNISKTEIIKLGSSIFNYSLEKTGGFPFTYIYADAEGLDAIAPVTLYHNVQLLHSWLFDYDGYEPSEAVKHYSDYIAGVTGYDETWIEYAEQFAIQEMPDTGSEADGS